MSTNYYIKSSNPEELPAFETDTLIHIGKSSIGWKFLFRTYPEQGVNSFEDWFQIMTLPGVSIFDEYGMEVRCFTLVYLITSKQKFKSHPSSSQFEVQKDAEGFECYNGEFC